jgi:hypothetical protein
VLGQNQAIQRTCAHFGIDPECLRQAWRVDLLERPGQVYYLAEFLVDGGLLVVAIDGETGLPRQTARLRSEGTIGVDAAKAREQAHARSDAPVRLVWKPCEASFSPLYPIWEIELESRKLFVNQQGRCWQRLTPKANSG